MIVLGFWLDEKLNTILKDYLSTDEQ